MRSTRVAIKVPAPLLGWPLLSSLVPGPEASIGTREDATPWLALLLRAGRGSRKCGQRALQRRLWPCSLRVVPARGQGVLLGLLAVLLLLLLLLPPVLRP